MRAPRLIAWHSHLWHLSDKCEYFAIGWRYLKGGYPRKDRRRKGEDKRTNKKKNKSEKMKVEVVAIKAFTYCCSFF